MYWGCSKPFTAQAMDLLYFAFANDSKEYLPLLTQEAKAIETVLAPGDLKQQRYRAVFDFSTTRDELVNKLTTYGDDIVLFHFSGHAGSKWLKTQEEITHKKGMASLLGQCKRLKLVFLNGCSTKGQLEDLLNAGVPAVIATNSPVPDDKAKEISAQFYKALSLDEQIGRAFEQAQGKLHTSHPDTAFELHRGVAPEEEWDEGFGEQWGFYVAKGKEEILKWQLPFQRQKPAPIDFVPNEQLIAKLYDGLADYSWEVGNLKRGEDLGMDVKAKDKRIAILDSLPAPIADQLRKLMAKTPDGENEWVSITKKRVEQLVKTFSTSIELFAFTWLSELWELLLENSEAYITPSQLASIKDFFSLEESARKTYSFLPLISLIGEIMDENNRAYTFKEWKDFATNNQEIDDFEQACNYLELLKGRLDADSFEESEVSEACYRGEESLATVLSTLGFLAKYKLVAIRMIDAVKFREKTARFEHAVYNLEKSWAGIDESTEQKDKVMDSRSILLISKHKNEDQYLNLSPFVLDENAFDKQNTTVPKVFFYYRFDAVNDHYELRHVYKPEHNPLIVNATNPYKMVKEQFEGLANLLFNTEMKNIQTT